MIACVDEVERASLAGLVLKDRKRVDVVVAKFEAETCSYPIHHLNLGHSDEGFPAISAPPPINSSKAFGGLGLGKGTMQP